jgi:hypothetical protein
MPQRGRERERERERERQIERDRQRETDRDHGPTCALLFVKVSDASQSPHGLEGVLVPPLRPGPVPPTGRVGTLTAECVEVDRGLHGLSGMQTH